MAVISHGYYIASIKITSNLNYTFDSYHFFASLLTRNSPYCWYTSAPKIQVMIDKTWSNIGAAVMKKTDWGIFILNGQMRCAV